MWARVAETMLGLWLCMSPLVFRGTEAVERFVWTDFAAGSAVVIFSLSSFWHRTAWAHLLTAMVAFLLGGRAYIFWERPGPPAAQNDLIVAMLLMLLAIIPNESSEPPKPWRAPARSKPARGDSESAL